MAKAGTICSACFRNEGSTRIPGSTAYFRGFGKQDFASDLNQPFAKGQSGGIDELLHLRKVGVHDKQIRTLNKACQPEKIVPAQIEMWDIAGLIKGASEGAGLGNKFLANIRSVSAIVHLVRCFSDINVIHVEDVTNLDPISEMENV